MTTAVRDGERRRSGTPSRRPRRVRSDRQNDMVPVAELARDGVASGSYPAPGSRRRAWITPSIGVQWVPAPPETRAGQPGAAIPTRRRRRRRRRRRTRLVVVAVDRGHARRRGGVVVRRGEAAGVLYGHRTR